MTKPSGLAATLARTGALQSDASDPRASVWVSANAGTGKTHVLTMRVLRLLIAGTPPERILCLTYTKAAAAEMSKRVFAELARWVVMPRQDLSAALAELGGRTPTEAALEFARTLFTKAIETPGGLKVQTIHAFCERLLQRFPLEADVPPGFAVLDEVSSRALLRESIDDVLQRATAPSAGVLGAALRTIVAYATDDRFDELLRAAVQKPYALEAMIRLSADGPDELAAAESLLRRGFNVREGLDRGAILEAQASVLGDADLRRLCDALRAGKKTDEKHADSLAAALAATTPSTRCKALSAYLLTANGGPRQNLMTKAVKDAHPELEALAQSAQCKLVDLCAQAKALDVVTATVALYRLASAVLQSYLAAKARRASLDYEDLITKTARLLTTAQSAEWVLYKLDGGLDHVLVDESQDTSPAAWTVVEALANEFFSGAGAREEARTLFAVGDEKQSIYSFQGAAPEMFAEMGARFAAMAEGAGRPWRRIPLDLSFRTVAPVLEAVDRVFADPQRTPGVAGSGGAVHHGVCRAGQAGLVEIWPTEVPADTPAADIWSEAVESASADPAVRLAERIADTIAGWLKRGERLPSEDRPIRAGDIIVLVRKRQPFAAPMVAALKARGIPVAGSDRAELVEHIAVKDLLALGDFLTLPEDDLALACVLKSPLFGFTDDDLYRIAYGRKGSLWKALLDARREGGIFMEAAETLKRWRNRSDFVPPFEFYASLFDQDGVRARLLARLGPEAADPIDELLSLALRFDDAEPASLQGFLDWLRDGTREIKRDMEHGRDEVRVMTVHGAKGLEAPIVFLPDTCTTASGGTHGALHEAADIARPKGMAAPFVWAVKGSGDLPLISAARTRAADKETEERHRLLYVAMTRARDRLYVAGFEGANGRARGCWYDLVSGALEGWLEEAVAEDGTRVLRRSSPQSAPPDGKDKRLMSLPEARPFPEWAHAAAPTEPQLSIPLAPSRLAPFDSDDSGEPVVRPRSAEPEREEPAPPARLVGEDGRFLRGTLTHALLEHLPAVPASDRLRLARQFLARRGSTLSPAIREAIVKETLAVLDDPVFAPLFGPQSEAEVPIAALVQRPGGAGVPLRLAGQIDRLAVVGDSVLIVDYKTNRAPPRTAADVAEAYLYQLAAYRLALSEIYQGYSVRAALLWTDGPKIMEISQEVLGSYAVRLWQLEKGRLDAHPPRS